MEQWLTLLGIPVGMIMLYLGSEWMVDGAKKIAFYFGVTPFVVGLTIVAFGSSAPEAITSVVSTATPDIILGNVVGSNIANIGLAIGLAAILSPIVCQFREIRFELVTMVVVCLAVGGMAMFGVINMLMGVILVVSLFVFVFLTLKLKKRDPSAEATEPDKAEQGGVKSSKSLMVSLVMVVVGIVILYFGARFFIDGAVIVAQMIGVSDLMIGLILVAVGTSLPELCICLVAAYRKENELVVSNIVGSVIFNCLFALGIGAVLVDIPIAQNVLVFHLPVMIIFALVMTLMVYRGNKVSRPEGVLIVGLYAAYIAAMAIWPELTQGVI
jgi:cation:H+ antiporter